MKHVPVLSRMLAIILLLVFAVTPSRAQTEQGQIAGNVTDNTGAAISGAVVTATETSSGSVYTTNSTSAGSYRFPSVQLGTYKVTTTSTGFKVAVNTGVVVRVGTVTSLPVSLTPGGVTDTITVDSNAPTVETESSDVGGVVTSREIIELPLALGGVGAMRSPEAFVFLIPGTVGPGSGNSNNGIFISKIGGGQNFGNEVLLDGASQTRSENGSSFDEEALSVEAISEFKVTTSTPAAEFGRTSGGIENFVTKSGSDQYHGSAFGIFRNEALDANDWFNNGRKAYFNSVGDAVDAHNNRRPADKQYDFGISLGGPVKFPLLYHGKDHPFFFFSWEQYRLSAGGVAISSVPTLAERAGDFSDRLIGGPNGQTNPCDGSPIQNGQIFDPATTQTVNGIRCRDAFPNNMIPQSRFSKVGQNLSAFYPAPTNSALFNNYSLASSSTLANTTYSIRIDQNIGTKDKMFASYSSRENTRNNPTFLTLPSPVDPSTQTQDFITHFVRGGWDHFFTGSLLNHLNLGFNRSNSINGSIEAGTGVNYNPQLGTPFSAGFPRVDVGGYVSLSRNQLDDNIDNGIRVNDDVSLQKGRNSFKFGIDYRYQQYSPLAKGQINGYLSFQNGQTKASQTGAYQDGTGNGYASLLLGLGDFSTSTVRATQPRWISNYYAGFVQDDFKVSNSLVLNIGLRYSIDQPRREAHNNTSNFSTTAIDPKNGLPGALVFATTCQGCNPRWADTYYKDIAPRIGFAYSPTIWQDKLVLRGGFSTLYAPLLYADFGGSMTTGYQVPTIQASDGFDPAYLLDGGVKPSAIGKDLDPAFYDNGNANQPDVFGNFIKASYGRPAEINQWNLQIQQELAKDLILTIGYMGSSGSHLRSGNENINNIPKSNFGRGDALVNYNLPANGVSSPYAAFNGNVQQALRPFPQYGFIATDCCLQNTGHSSYEALIASVDRRFSHGLTARVSYTWSKDLTNADSALPGITAGVNQVQDPFNGPSQKALSIQDIPHTLVISSLYELPFGKDKAFLNLTNPLGRAIVSGFKIGGVLRYQSGEPISFGGASGIPGWDNHIDFTRLPGSHFQSKARTGHIDPFRILRAGGKVQGPDPNVDSEFNGLFRTDNAGYSALQTAPALYDQNSGPNRILRANQVGTCPTCDNGGFEFGDVPRVTGEIRNYLYNNEDFSLLKETPIKGNIMFILKAEFLNAFNRHIFGSPDTNPYDVYFGVPTYTIDGPRKIQLTGRFEF